MEGASLIRILAPRALPTSSCLAGPSSTFGALRRGSSCTAALTRRRSRSSRPSSSIHSQALQSSGSSTGASLRALPTSFNSARRLSTAPSEPGRGSASPAPSVLAAYQGPLHSTFRRLKAFSLLSFGLAGLITPVLLFGPGEVAMSGRIALSLTALTTSGVSTALIAWVGGPYVQRMRLLSPPSPPSASSTTMTTPVMELVTLDWLMRERVTEVHDARIIKATSRPFATWELDEDFEHLSLGGGKGEEEGGGQERLVARTTDGKGVELGRWTVSFDGQGDGEAERWTRKEGDEAGFKKVGRLEVKGKVHKHFQVHEEALGDEWRVV